MSDKESTSSLEEFLGEEPTDLVLSEDAIRHLWRVVKVMAHVVDHNVKIIKGEDD